MLSKGKITVNLQRKSIGNRLWFEVSGVNCIIDWLAEVGEGGRRGNFRLLFG